MPRTPRGRLQHRTSKNLVLFSNLLFSAGICLQNFLDVKTQHKRGKEFGFQSLRGLQGLLENCFIILVSAPKPGGCHRACVCVCVNTGMHTGMSVSTHIHRCVAMHVSTHVCRDVCAVCAPVGSIFYSLLVKVSLALYLVLHSSHLKLGAVPWPGGLVGAASCTLKCCGFDPQSGHISNT